MAFYAEFDLKTDDAARLLEVSSAINGSRLLCSSSSHMYCVIYSLRSELNVQIILEDQFLAFCSIK